MKIAIMILAAAMVAVAQQPPQPAGPPAEKLTPKAAQGEVDTLRHDLALQKAKTAWESIKALQGQAKALNDDYQSKLKELQQKYGDASKSLNDYKLEVCKENGWKAEEVNYDPESDTWSKTPPKPKQPERAPEKK